MDRDIRAGRLQQKIRHGRSVRRCQSLTEMFFCQPDFDQQLSTGRALTFKPDSWVFYQDFLAGIAFASGLVVLGGTAAVACAEAVAAGAATV